VIKIVIKMFSLLSYGIGSAAVAVFLYLDGYNITKNTTLIKFQKFRQINKLVSINYKGYFKILWISLCMIRQALWISLLQYMNSSVIKLGGNKYVITYIINGKTYKMLIKSKRGPQKVLMVSDETQTDVSDLIFPYLGPCDNFHGDIFTPEFFGRKELIFDLSDGSEKIFLESDKIIL
jgi:hypothetical protein